MSSAAWAGIVTVLLIALIYSLRPVLMRYADRHHWKKGHRNG